MRRRPEGKLLAVAEAALETFIDQGYRLAQMSEIARRAGMSAGALYLYVEGKEALLHVAFLHAARQLDPALALPIKGESVDGVLAEIRGTIAGRRPWTRLKAARRRPAAVVAEEVAGIADELYDLLHNERRVHLLLSRCERDLPALAEVYDGGLRGPYLADLAAYLAAGVKAGRLHLDAAPAAAARGVVELVAWMAMHRLRHAAPPDISEPEARRAARALVVGGVCGPA